MSYSSSIRPTILLYLHLLSLAPALAQNFGPAQTTGTLQAPSLNEVSGLAVSRRNPGVLWVHNDSGGAPALYAINAQGTLLGSYTISGAVNRDWEDIAIGPGPDPDQAYLYIGEIGDNQAVYPSCAILRVPEPSVPTSAPPVTATLNQMETLAFTYADGPRDAETLMLDPFTRDLYVVTKRETNIQVYVLTYPQSTNTTPALTSVLTLPFTQAVAGDISPSGQQIAIKTYLQTFWWPRPPTQTVTETLAGISTTLPHALSFSFPQNEALAWADWDAGYFTLAEGVGAPLVLFTNLDGIIEPDIDVDGIEDHWEWDHFQGLATAGTESDQDGDRMTDQEEFVADTDPTNALSFLHLAVEGLDPEGSIALAWTGAAGRTYQIMTAPTPAQSYLPVYTTSVADTGALVVTTPVPDSVTAFIRLEVTRDE